MRDSGRSLQVVHYVQSPNSQKTIRPRDEVINDQVMMKWWWKLWWNYDEIGLKTSSKYLARMKGCWDPEFEPSVEEIVDYRWDMAILSVRFLWRACTRGDFPIQSSTWQWRSRSDQPAKAACPNIRVYGACAVCRCVLVQIMAAYISAVQYFSWGCRCVWPCHYMNIQTWFNFYG